MRKPGKKLKRIFFEFNNGDDLTMRVTKASAAVTAEKLSPRARQLVAAMFIHKRKFNFTNKREYGLLTTELVCAHVIRPDWDIMAHDHVFILERTGHFVVEHLRADTTQHGIPAHSLCEFCQQPMLPPGVVKKKNEYDHASGCPAANKTKWQPSKKYKEGNCIIVEQPSYSGIFQAKGGLSGAIEPTWPGKPQLGTVTFDNEIRWTLIRRAGQ